MAQSQWRCFQFFDKGWTGPGKVAKSLGESLKVGELGQNPNINNDAAAYLPAKEGGTHQRARMGCLYFGDNDGVIHVADEDCNPTFKFIAFGGIIKSLRVAYLKTGESETGVPVLCALGMMDPPGQTGGDVYGVKFFNCEQLIQTAMNTPLSNQAVFVEPQRVALLPNAPSRGGSDGARQPQISAFAVSSNGTLVSVGFSNGSILLLRSEDPTNPTAKNKSPLFLFPPDPYSASQEGGAPANIPYISGLIFGDRRVKSVKANEPTKPGRKPQPILGKASRLFVTTNGGGAGDKDGDNGAASSDGSVMGSGVVCCFDMTNVLSISGSGVDGGHNVAMVTLDDDNGCAVNCCSHNANDHQILVARNDAVFSFTSEDRAGAAGFEGNKQALCCLTGQLVEAPGFVIVASHNTKSSRTEVNVYDLANKFVAFNHRLDPKQIVVGILAGTSVAYLMVYSPTSGLCVIRIKERDTPSKLDLLLKMNYYQHAIMLAKQAHYSAEEVNNMVLMFADHKYKKCDWDGAITQYSHTIGYTEPSYVIRKFLDAQRIANLTVYLEKLHIEDEGAHSTKDHTALLLNCYTKLKSTAKLDAFVSGRITGGCNFDVEAAMTCLRRAGYRSHALQLIKKFKHKHQHEWVVELLLEEEAEAKKQADRHLENSDFGGQKDKKVSANDDGAANEELSVYAREALQYMRGLPQESVEFLLAKFGRQLIRSQPEPVTRLVGDLCTGVYQPMGGAFAEAIVASKMAEAAAKADLDEDAASDGKTLRNKFGKKASSATTTTTSAGAGGATDSELGTSSRKSNPDAFMTLFIDNSSNLRSFLQRIVDQALEGNTSTSGGKASMESSTVSETAANTLLELLLQDWKQSDSSEVMTKSVGGGTAVVDPAVLAARKAEKAARVMNILQNYKLVPYDKFHALVQVQVHGFKEGQHLLLERLSRGVDADGGVVTDLLVDYYFECAQIEEVLRVCKRESNAEARPNPPLWAKVLTALVLRCQLVSASQTSAVLPGGGSIKLCEDEDELEEAYDFLIDFMAEIERDKILPPFQVMQLLSLNANLPLSVAINFLSKFMKDAVTTIDDHQEQIKELRVKTANICESIGDMGDVEARRRSSHLSSSSSSASQPTSSGVVYTEATKWEEMKRSMSKGAADNEARFAELERSRDGFSTIAKFFGEGMIR